MLTKTIRSAAALGVTLLFPLFFWVNGAKAAPELVSDTYSYNFGSVDETEEVEHDFILRNIGDEPVIIQKIDSSCGCTTTRLGGKVLQPGISTVLTAKINLRGRRGSQNKHIYVQSNDPKQPQLVLKMVGNVTSQIDIFPRRIDFMDIKPDQSVSRTAMITNNAGKPMRITGMVSTGKFFSVDRKTIEEGKRYQIEIKTKPPLQNGMSRGSVTIKTNNPKYATISIPVTVRVPSDIVVAPRIISVPYDGKESKPISFFTLIKSRGNKPFNITRIDKPDQKIHVKIITLGIGSYRIKIDNLVPSTKLNGKIISIYTDMESCRELKLPIQVYRRDKTSSNESSDSEG